MVAHTLKHEKSVDEKKEWLKFLETTVQIFKGEHNLAIHLQHMGPH